MKTLIQIIAIASATLFASCEKYETPAPAPADYHNGNGSSNGNGSPNGNGPSYDNLNYNLDWSSEQLGISLIDIKPTSIKPMVDVVNGQSHKYGEFVSFDIPDKNVLIEFHYEYGVGIIQGSGRINGHPFILNLESSTINLCNYYQNVSVVYDLFSTENDVDS